MNTIIVSALAIAALSGSAQAGCWKGMDVTGCVTAFSLTQIAHDITLDPAYLIHVYIDSQQDPQLRGMDLDHDGRPEMLLHLVTPQTCSVGVAACVQVIQSTDAERRVLFAQAVHDLTVLPDETVGGWAVIMTRTHASDRCDYIGRYVSEGGEYRLQSETRRC